MNKKWRETLDKCEALVGNKNHCKEGLDLLVEVRNEIFSCLRSSMEGLSNSDYAKIPFANAHNFATKSIAYHIYYTYRVEDILLNTVIKNEEQMFFSHGYRDKLNISLTVPTEDASAEEIKAFSERISIDALWEYAAKVNEAVNEYLCVIAFDDVKRHFGSDDIKRLDASSFGINQLHSLRLNRWSHETLYGFIIRDFSYTPVMNYEACMQIKEAIG